MFANDFRPFAVPVFMLITFFLASRHFAANDGEWLRKRFYRLCLPFVFWSVLAFVTWRLLSPHFPAFAIDPTDGAFWGGTVVIRRTAARLRIRVSSRKPSFTSL